ncbi:MAG TPA: ankyrin repeat domain-containing protein [Thermoanaerobaculia bacterium]|jgi:ankyrin repeat protein|nr:ankyrin repeat domain-containing protein [Thermoanaerobaculia bacterium]
MRFAGLFLLLIIVALPLAADDAADFLKAVSGRDLATVKSMLARDPALANARSPKGTDAVTIALFTNVGEGFTDPAKNEILQAILPHAKLDLFETAALGTTSQLESMMTDPASLTSRNAFGWTLLHMAAFGGNAANTELLIRKGAVIESRAVSKFRNTPLQTALLSGQYATAKILIDHGADVLIRQSKGFTPMHEAAVNGRTDLVQLLLDHGAEINSVADNGETPLAEAMRGKHDELAAWMKAKGAVLGIQPDDEVLKK